MCLGTAPQKGSGPKLAFPSPEGEPKPPESFPPFPGNKTGAKINPSVAVSESIPLLIAYTWVSLESVRSSSALALGKDALPANTDAPAIVTTI